MSELAPVKSTSSTSNDQTWIGSSHGHDAGVSGTLTIDAAIAAFAKNDGKTLPAGIALAYDEATEQYVLWTAESEAPLAGFLLADIEIRDRKNELLSKSSIAVLVHGRVIRANLPVPAQRTAITYLTPQTSSVLFG